MYTHPRPRRLSHSSSSSSRRLARKTTSMALASRARRRLRWSFFSFPLSFLVVSCLASSIDFSSSRLFSFAPQRLTKGRREREREREGRAQRNGRCDFGKVFCDNVSSNHYRQIHSGIEQPALISTALPLSNTRCCHLLQRSSSPSTTAAPRAMAAR